MMKVHHLNCACMCPIGGKLFPSVFPRKVICHCLLIESKAGLVLIDAGFAKTVTEKPRRMGLLYPFLGLQANGDAAAIEQVKTLGFNSNDVRHIIPTHLDNDHAGGALDFDFATIHTSEIELNTVLKPRTLAQKIRFREFTQGDPSRWQAHRFTDGEPWFGFQGVRPIPNMDDEVLLIPLFGHTPGHFGVAVKTGERWLLHVGDSYYDRRELTTPETLGLKIFHRIMHDDFKAARQNQQRLIELQQNHGNEVQLISAHDPAEFPEDTRAIGGL